METEEQKVIKKLRSLRNIGHVTAKKLVSIGIKTPEQMKQSNPEVLFEKLKKKSGEKLDKCVLYQFQGAILDLPWWECKHLTKDKAN